LGTKNNLTLDEARERAALVSDPRYDITLDLTGERSFRSETVIRFRCSGPGAETFVDLTANEVLSIELNGGAIEPDLAYDDNRIRLTGLASENELRIVADCTFFGAEFGMHRFVDPVDSNVYAHTHFEPFGAHRVYACFDQPDLKGEFDFHAVVPEGWLAISNARPAGDPEPAGPDTVRWSFETTRRISTYITAVCAGPYHAVRERHRDIDLGLYCRQSLAPFMDSDELFEITRQGFDFFEPAFGYPYMFGGKYDQIFIPESNTGAMEDAACVTFNDIYLFRSRVTDAARERRAETILHEMAHMWFGDLVTMEWWNDLWLNESFASYMAVLSQTEATRWKDAWATFADTEKGWALRQDQLPTTHPIVADVPDVESVHLNFDGISYAKGASALRQLVAWVGKDRFLEGVRTYCKRHEFANARLDDFLVALEQVSGRDLHEWSKLWLETAGVNTLRADFADAGDGTFGSFALAQTAPEAWPTLRPHRVAVGLYDREPDGLRLRRRVEFDAVGARTGVPDLAGERIPDLTLVNDGDLTFAKIRLDERSLRTVVEHLREMVDSLALALCWTACWDMTRDGEMAARDYLRLVIENIARETKVGVVQSLLTQAAGAVYIYGDPANRPAAGGALADASFGGLGAAEPGSDHQLAWARSFASSARSEEHLATVRGLLDGSVTFDGLAIDTELRWHLVRTLAAAGAIGEDSIQAELARDPSDRGTRHAASARAGRPDATAKEWAWRVITEEDDKPLALVSEVMAGFHQAGQEELLRPFRDRYFEALPKVWETKDLPDALAFGGRMYPHPLIEQETLDRTDAYLAGPSVPAPVRRMLLEGRDGVRRALRTREVDAGRAG
jgi:aminopeptidase N